MLAVGLPEEERPGEDRCEVVFGYVKKCEVELSRLLFVFRLVSCCL